MIDNVYLGGENKKVTNHLKSAKSPLMCAKIKKNGRTQDEISSRDGMPIFLRYVEKIEAYGLISKILLVLSVK